jgi:cytochrome b561
MVIRNIIVAGFVCLMLSLASAPVHAEDDSEGLMVSENLNTSLLENVADNDHRLAYQADSIVGIGIVLFAFLVAYLLNHARPSKRVLGTFFSAMAALGTGLLILWLGHLGSLDAMRPMVLPTDNLKPDLMRILSGVLLLSGAFLLLVTYWQTKRDDVLDLGLKNEENRFGRQTRILHWTTAILFLLLIPMGIFTSMIPEDVWYRQGYYVVHKSIGFSVLGLVLLRLVWHRISPATEIDSSLKTWERRLARTAHFLLYGFMIAFPISGFIMSTYGGKYSHFFFWDFPLFWGADMDAVIPYAVLHKLVLPLLFFVVIGAHVAGALKHRFVDRHENAFRRMVG